LKKTLQQAKPKVYKRIVGIDSSTTGIAMCLLVEGKPKTAMYLSLPHSEFLERMHRAREWFAAALMTENPEFVMIEAPIYIQNPMTTKNLSYIVGMLIGECLHKDIPVVDVSPATWKGWLGCKPVTKNMKINIIEQLGQTEGRKEIQRLRKSQVQDIMRDRFPYLNWDNDNVADSAGIALYANNLYGVKDDRTDSKS
jgi:Holliday junction resolvasome RuvABC endonuclease subunit